MAIPTPSFWKIRKYLIIILVIIYCFVIGALKQAFAAYDPSSAQVVCTNAAPQGEAYIQLNADPGYVLNKQQGTFNYSATLPAQTTTWARNTYRLYYCDRQYGNTWQQYASVITYSKNSCNAQPELQGQQCNPCWNQRQEMQNQCGGDINVDWSNWSDQTCSGAVCKDACPEGEERTEAWGCKPICESGVRVTTSGDCIPHCPYIDERQPGTINNYGKGVCVDPPCGPGEIENADGSCKHNCIKPAQMDVMTGECFTPAPKCGPCETLSGMDCLAPPNCGAGKHRNYETCECDETPEKIPECPANQHWNGVKCVPDKVEPCPDGYNKDAKGDCVKDPKWCPKGQHWDGEMCVPNTEMKDPTQPLPPGASDSDKLSDINTNIGTVASNIKSLGEKIGELGSTIGTKIGEAVKALSNVGESIKTAVDGAKTSITNAVNGLKSQLAGIDAGIGNVTNELKTINQGSYVKPADKEPYTPPEHSFNQRTEQFLSDVKSSPMFALPNSLANSIPGGGSPILTIETGSTFGGAVQIDFSELSSALIVLRALFQIMGITLAIRIITLKR